MQYYKYVLRDLHFFTTILPGSMQKALISLLQGGEKYFPPTLPWVLIHF